MRVLAAIFLAVFCQADTLEVRRQMLARLGAEADKFERSAYRVAGLETLRQTLPAGIVVSKRGLQTRVPERNRVIVSQYGYVPVDEKGGSLKETRSVMTIDGLAWNKPKKGLDGIAQSITAKTDSQRRKLLEDFESHALQGFITDASQAILLFARGNSAKYEFLYDSAEPDDSGTPMIVYRFQQIEGPEAFRVYEGKQVLTDKIRGKLWVRASDALPMRLGLETVREIQRSKMRDTVVVSYQESEFGFLLPKTVLHEQYENGSLTVLDRFEYSSFKEILPSAHQR